MGTPLHDMIIRGMRETFLASPATSPPLLVHTDPYSLESNRQHGVAAPWAVLHIVQTSSTASTSSPTPRLPASSSSAISTTPPSHILCLPNPELLVLLSGTTLSGPPENTMLSRLRARGLINEGNICVTNAVLQVLMYCLPFLEPVQRPRPADGSDGSARTGASSTD